MLPPCARHVHHHRHSRAVTRVPADRWDAPSLCPVWTGRQLTGHVIDGQQQIVSLLTGHGPRPPVTDPALLTALAGPDPGASWQRTHQNTERTLAALDPATVVDTPLGARSVDEVLTVAVIEPLVHAWDLATTIGQTVQLDPDTVTATLPAVEALGGQLAATGMYAAAQPAPADSPPQDRLLAALGRRWTPRN
ncbi:TIGR03086 family protein [Frankia sp. CcI156]|uniref:TIGR03086 family metal-binding protein n=1 Tax=Frankia sp. CcI156 TaxID=1745380 RepID=UPI00068A6186|nr:TIGR03086 family metal-binding protein [Frankia sp. CcI156]OHV53205.1 TIGR03086 family protein [Frankia sp. CgIS1]ONH24850.1 TIGR03086 family protein [Frankia sp. CcI156]